MRSRFTAYRVKNAEHLLRSWDSSHRPETIEFGREKFVRLTVHESRVSPDHSGSAIVNYTALSISGNEIITLSESSRFTYRKNRWFYIDGDVRISRERLRAKSPCPCGSGKKSKRCCLV